MPSFVLAYAITRVIGITSSRLERRNDRPGDESRRMPASDLFLAAAAFFGSAVNAAAGGGSFISFPALLATGVPAIAANATNNTAMWLGALASAGTFRRDLDVRRPVLMRALVVSMIGGALGALTLLHTSNATFTALVPWLLLVATTLFIAGPHVTAFARTHRAEARFDSGVGYVGQFVIAFYGGFFGAAIGILMLALLAVLDFGEMRKANALKALLATAINGTAVVPFLLAGAVLPHQAIVMSVGTVLGGVLGARLVRRLPSGVVRGFVVAVACTMTVYFFWKTYMRGT